MLQATILRASSAPADVTTDDQIVRIAVAENPSTAPGRAGVGGRRLFLLRADRPGTAVVELALVRPWQPDAPADSLVVRLDA
jgi:predicted secreted protein